jgi:hypothetical protein
MRWDVFDGGRHIVLLQESAKVVCDSLGGELAACRLPADVQDHLIDDVVVVLRQFVGEIEDIVEAFSTKSYACFSHDSVHRDIVGQRDYCLDLL